MKKNILSEVNRQNTTRKRKINVLCNKETETVCKKKPKTNIKPKKLSEKLGLNKEYNSSSSDESLPDNFKDSDSSDKSDNCNSAVKKSQLKNKSSDFLWKNQLVNSSIEPFEHRRGPRHNLPPGSDELAYF